MRRSVGPFVGCGLSGVEGRADPGHMGAGAWQTSGCALCWVGLRKERGDGLTLSLWSELKPGLSRAPSSWRRLIFQYFMASCVYNSCKEGLGHSASCTPTGRRCGAALQGQSLPSSSSVPARDALGASQPYLSTAVLVWLCRKPVSVLCRCVASLSAAQLASSPPPAGFLSQLGWAQARGVCWPPELLGQSCFLLCGTTPGPC